MPRFSLSHFDGSGIQVNDDTTINQLKILMSRKKPTPSCYQSLQSNQRKTPFNSSLDNFISVIQQK